MTESAREACLQGLATEWRTMTYTWRDCALYALAVGAGGAEPQYTYERGHAGHPTLWGNALLGDRECHPQTAPAPAPSRCWWRRNFETRAVLCQPGV